MRMRRLFGSTLALPLALALLAGSAAAESYKLGISDRLKIKVQEWPDLGGEYTVSADGFVSLPLIGNIKALDLTLNDLGHEISARLQQRDGGAERPLAAVEIIQYRPFSIVGDVQRPGEYPYRPGLTVLEAVAIAGGYYRPETGILRLDRDVALATGEIRTLRLKLVRLLAREARLTAALAGREDIPLPVEFANQKDDPAISAIMESEQTSLTRENDLIRSEREALDNIKSIYQREIASLRGQVEALTHEHASIQQQFNELQSLSTRGLALTPTLFLLERSLAQVVNEQMSAETGIMRVEESIALAEQRVQQLALERSRANTRDLQQARDEIKETRAHIGTQGDLLNEAQIRTPAEVRERLTRSGERSNFTIVRKDGEVTREIAADQASSVLPNDVIKVPTPRANLPASGDSGQFNMSHAENSDQTDR